MPEGGRPAPYHHGDLRNALYRYALRTIETSGVEALSLREAARSLGVTPAAVYRHFPDKAALVAAVVEEGIARLTRVMEGAAKAAAASSAAGAAGAAGDPRGAAFVAMCLAYVRFAGAHPSHFRAMLGGAGSGAGAPHQLLGAALDQHLGPACPVAARRAAKRAALASVYGLALLIAGGTEAQREPAACDAATREVIEILLRGMAPAGTEGGPRVQRVQREEREERGSRSGAPSSIGVSAKERSPGGRDTSAPSAPRSSTSRRSRAGNT